MLKVLKKINIHALCLSGGTRFFQQATQQWGLERNLSVLALGSDILSPGQQKWNWPFYHLPHAIYSPAVRALLDSFAAQWFPVDNFAKNRPPLICSPIWKYPGFDHIPTCMRSSPVISSPKVLQLKNNFQHYCILCQVLNHYEMGEWEMKLDGKPPQLRGP